MSQGETAQRVDDEEQTVAKKRKNEILEARKNVRDWREQLFTAARTGELTDKNAVVLFGDPVREYLMNIEPLLQLDLPDAQKVYEEEELGTIRLEPPEEYREAAQGRRSPGERPTKSVSGDLGAHEHVITGLKEVIERESVSASWTVHIRYSSPSEAPDGRVRQTLTPTVEEPLSREVLRNAVREADKWLQNAGLGLELDAKPYRSEEPGI